MSQIGAPLQDPEEHLRQLEEKVDKLVIALDEWRQWKQEYEALQKDVEALSPIATRSARTQTREGFKGELVDGKELIGIFGQDDSRKRDQVLSTVSNRLDYVSKNITTLTKQLEIAENGLANSRVATDSAATDEDGLPFTEISEQLDDDDNVISYSLRRPGDSQAQLVEALEKAGIKDLPPSSSDPVPDVTSNTPNSSSVQTPSSDTKRKPRSNGGTTPEPPKAKQMPKKKSVTFTEDTKEADEEKPNNTVQSLEELYRQAKDQETIISDPVMPADESPEDAELREDMIRYNRETMMYEMAPIVAELQLEEGSDDDDWNYDDSEDDDDDDEDEWGRSTSGVVDDEYRREMLELKERLSQKTFGNQEAASDEDDEFAEGIGRITIKQESLGSAENSSKPPAVKGDVVPEPPSKSDVEKSVRFAPSLDIAETSPSAAQAKPPQSQELEVDPLSDVVERKSSKINKTTSISGRKPSRFRKERANDVPATQALPIAPEKPTNVARYAPSGPEGQTLATAILEHEPSNEVKEPDELDADLLHQQVTEEYYKMRNKMISRHGGFLKENTDPIQPLEEEEGGPKRVSRFKAARLARS
ncbi:hypothetical protein O1611_g8232 [Lasiodiplodia mahajangana]|uniref:Uncharacterized protein n=1 Tax=Lasiodiplodia mahajangana TaxID=1108764 RepID=A0ACC2JDV8_9PEZI|nr:hypothetical protein O1611_g8232 [Lasiodiplodia mahajangana]